MSTKFHGEFSSADAHALDEPTSRFALFDSFGTAIVLGAHDVVVITDREISCASAGLAQIYDGADNAVDAGEAVCWINSAASGGICSPISTPHFCKKGTYPKVKAVAGQINCIIRGYIYNRPGV